MSKSAMVKTTNPSVVWCYSSDDTHGELSVSLWSDGSLVIDYADVFHEIFLSDVRAMVDTFRSRGLADE